MGITMKEKQLKIIIKSLNKKINRTEKRFNILAEMWAKVPYEMRLKIKRELGEKLPTEDNKL